MRTPSSGTGGTESMAPTALAWAAFGVLGAGIVHAGLASGRTASAGWALALAVVGLAETAWALLALRAGRPLAPRPTAVALLTVAGAWPALVAQGVAPHDGGLTASDAAAVVLGVVGAGAIAVGARTRGTRRTRSAVGALTGWAAAAVVTAAITTPGLAATPAGAVAVPHGQHGQHGGPAPAPPAPAPPADHPGH